MILKALYDYYHRLGTLPPPGSEAKEIEFVLIIDKNGQFKRIESKRIDNKKCASFIVPKGVIRTSAPNANSLWDNGKYVLGLEESHTTCNDLFIERVKRIADDNPNDISMRALRAFYAIPKPQLIEELRKDPLFHYVETNLSSNFSFQLEGENVLIAEKLDLIKNSTIQDDVADGPCGVCLVTGDKGPLVRLTTPTPIPGNSPMATLVGIQVNSGYDSYGKTQAYNSPISKSAEFAFTTALKSLIGKDSCNKFKVGNRLFLFWGTGKAAHQVEDSFFVMTSIEFDKKDDPNEKIGKVEKLMKSIWSGQISTTLEDRFFILGMAPNTGRISVVSWDDMTLKDFAGRLLQHFEDMEIADTRKPGSKKPYSGLYTMLSTITLSGKVTDCPSTLIEETLHAITTGTQYPFALYTSTLERIRADLHDHAVTIARAAILKAYINRATKFQTNITPLTVMLDKTNDNQGYVCGRLAAVLEHIQNAINGGDTIRTTYLTAASATPASVYPAMLALSNHHSDKLQAGSRIYYERLKQEIISLLPPTGFPARLDLIDQGRFFVGYYHQRQDLFTKKDEK